MVEPVVGETVVRGLLLVLRDALLVLPPTLVLHVELAVHRLRLAGVLCVVETFFARGDSDLFADALAPTGFVVVDVVLVALVHAFLPIFGNIRARATLVVALAPDRRVQRAGSGEIGAIEVLLGDGRAVLTLVLEFFAFVPASVVGPVVAALAAAPILGAAFRRDLTGVVVTVIGSVQVDPAELPGPQITGLRSRATVGARLEHAELKDGVGLPVVGGAARLLRRLARGRVLEAAGLGRREADLELFFRDLLADAFAPIIGALARHLQTRGRIGILLGDERPVIAVVLQLVEVVPALVVRRIVAVLTFVSVVLAALRRELTFVVAGLCSPLIEPADVDLVAIALWDHTAVAGIVELALCACRDRCQMLGRALEPHRRLARGGEGEAAGLGRVETRLELAIRDILAHALAPVFGVFAGQREAGVGRGVVAGEARVVLTILVQFVGFVPALVVGRIVPLHALVALVPAPPRRELTAVALRVVERVDPADVPDRLVALAHGFGAAVLNAL